MHIILKPQKVKERGQKEKAFPYKGIKTNIYIFTISSQTMQARRDWREITKLLEEKLPA